MQPNGRGGVFHLDGMNRCLLHGASLQNILVARRRLELRPLRYAWRWNSSPPPDMPKGCPALRRPLAARLADFGHPLSAAGFRASVAAASADWAVAARAAAAQGLHQVAVALRPSAAA